MIDPELQEALEEAKADLWFRRMVIFSTLAMVIGIVAMCASGCAPVDDDGGECVGQWSCEARWGVSQYPVWVATDLEDLQFRKDTHDAIEWWNAKAGRRILALAPPEDDAVGITVSVGDLRSMGLRGATGVDHTPGDRGCYVTRADVTIDLQSKRDAATIAHELGHALGLAHEPSGLMQCDRTCTLDACVTPVGLARLL